MAIELELSKNAPFQQHKPSLSLSEVVSVVQTTTLVPRSYLTSRSVYNPPSLTAKLISLISLCWPYFGRCPVVEKAAFLCGLAEDTVAVGGIVYL
jgi:hypothetical protein